MIEMAWEDVGTAVFSALGICCAGPKLCLVTIKGEFKVKTNY